MSESRRRDIAALQRAMEAQCEVSEFVRLLTTLKRRWTPTVSGEHLEKYVDAGFAHGAFNPTAVMATFINHPSIVESALRMAANPSYICLPNNADAALLILCAGGEFTYIMNVRPRNPLWQDPFFLLRRDRILPWRRVIAAHLQLHCDIEKTMHRHHYSTHNGSETSIVLNDVRVAILGQTVDLPEEILRKVRGFLLDG